METKGGGGFCEVVEEALAIFVLVGFHALLDVEFTVFEQAADDSIVQANSHPGNKMPIFIVILIFFF